MPPKLKKRALIDLCRNTIIKGFTSKIAMILSFKEITTSLLERIFGIKVIYLKVFRKEGINLVKKVNQNILI